MRVAFGILFLFMFCCLHAQYLTESAESMAVAGSGVAYTDFWNGSNNQSALAWSDDMTVGVGYNNRYMLSQLSNRNLTFAYPLKNKGGVFSLNVNQYGYSAYRISKGGLAYSRLFGEKFAAALQFDMFQFNFGDEYYGKNVAFTFEGGLQYKINKQLSIGTHIFNPVRAKLSSSENEVMPSAISLGLALSLSKNVAITTDVVKESDYPASLRVGFMYRFREIFNVRAGFASAPFNVSGGVGFNLNGFNFNISTSYYQTLGIVPAVSLFYQIKSGKK